MFKVVGKGDMYNKRLKRVVENGDISVIIMSVMDLIYVDLYYIYG